VRLKWLVILAVIGVQLSVAALVTSTTWRSVSDGVDVGARESMRRLGIAARERFSDFVGPAEDASLLVQRLLASDTIRWSEPERMESFLFEALRLQPVFDAIYFGLSSGEFLYVKRVVGPGEYSILVKEIRLVDGERRVTFRQRDPDFQLLRSWEDPEDRFDPRLRPWFAAAGSFEASRWTDPYVFFTSRRAGVSTANAVVSADGRDWGAVAVDIEIASFSEFLGTISSETGVAFIVDREGRLVAGPSGPAGRAPLFTAESGFGGPTQAGSGLAPLVTAAARGTPQSARFEVDGRNYLADIQPFERGSMPWLMVVAAPADALFDWVHALRDQIVAVTLTVAAAAAILMLIAWRYAVDRPIAAVSARLRGIALGLPDAQATLSAPAEFRDLDLAVAEAGRRIREREESFGNLVRTLREYEHAVQQSPAGIAILENDGRVVFANETYRRLVGPRDPLGDAPLPLRAEIAGAASLSSRMKTVRSGRTLREDVSLARPDGGGDPMVLQCVLAPLSADDEGGIGRVLLLVEDVTSRKGVEQRLIEARNAAERSDRAKTAFLGQMSHELRTPLNAIIGFSEVMRAEIFGPIGSTRYADYVGHIETSAKHLKELIDRVLDLSRVEQGAVSINFQKIDPAVPVVEAAEMVRPAAAEAGIVLVVDVDDTPPSGSIVADPAAIRQIVVNLASNAVKFSPRGGLVTVSLRAAVGGGAEIEVEDQGIGIDAQDLPYVFEPFWQGGPAWDAGRVGVGLGLSIVRTLVDRHHGRIDIDSRPGAGTRLRVWLPSAPPAATDGATSVAANRTG